MDAQAINIAPDRAHEPGIYIGHVDDVSMTVYDVVKQKKYDKFMATYGKEWLELDENGYWRRYIP